MTHPHWPLWDLRIRTPRLELRPVRESEMADLSELIDGGIHDPATMPFLIPFTDAPNPQRTRDSYRFWMGCWAGWSVESWRLVLAAYSDGRCVGSQDLQATDFPTLRTVTTGSWLGLPHQGHGLGREMRAAALQLAFEGLGAQRAATEAFEDNVASLRVTESLGYHPNGSEVVRRRDGRATVRRYVLERDDWEPRRRDDIALDGLGPECLDMFGLS
ncbi:MAG TPA: GNAT family protein [Microthrixaceae bacterium]|nr:GNAT family protein [Microthrixaceae bacterium]